MHRFLLLIMPFWLSLLGLAEAVTVGESATFQAQSDGASSYEWSFPNGDIRSGATVKYTFTQSGVFPVTLKVTGPDGQSNQITKTVTVNHGDRPTAIIKNSLNTNGDIRVTSGSTFSLEPDFTGQDREALTHFWTINGRNYNQTQITERELDDIGLYQVNLIVYDQQQSHLRDQASVRVVIENEGPVVSGLSVQADPEGRQVEVSAQAEDADGGIESYRFEVLENGRTVLSQVLSTPKASFNLSQFPGNHEYQFRVTVTDDRQGVTRYDHPETLSLNSNVENNAPVMEIIVAPGNEGTIGQWFNFLADASDPDRDALKYQWIFPDGQQYFSSQVRYRFMEPGEQTIQVRVSDGLETLEDSIVVRINDKPNQAPTVKIMSILPSPSGDTSTLFKFSALGSDLDRDPLTYEWDMGDGGKAVSNTPSYRFSEPGTYTVTLQADDGREQASTTATVQVREAVTADEAAAANNQAPIATASALSDTAMVNTPIRFVSDASDPDFNTLQYNWDMGDGVRYFTPQVTHTYRTPGVYEPILTVSDGFDEVVSQVAVNITNADGSAVEGAEEILNNTAPQVRILSVDPQLSGSTDTVFRFYSQGQDADRDELTYLWDMGDGQQMFIKNPAYRYETPGSYTVTVTVNDGITTQSDSLLINVVDPTLRSSATDTQNSLPQASITGVAPGTEGSTFTLFRFFAQANDNDGDDLRYTWDFGDGRSLSGQNPVYRYQEPGTYEATVSVSDDESTATANVVINVKEEALQLNNPENNQAPTTNLSVFPLAGDTATIFRLQADSQDPDGDNILYDWDMGDGTFYFGPEVEHQYTETGEYEVKLKTTDGLGTSLADTTLTVTEAGLAPTVFGENFKQDNPLGVIDQLKFGENSCEHFFRRLSRPADNRSLSFSAAIIALQAEGQPQIADQLKTWHERAQAGEQPLKSFRNQLSPAVLQQLLAVDLDLEKSLKVNQALVIRRLKNQIANYKTAKRASEKTAIQNELNQTLSAHKTLIEWYDYRTDKPNLDEKVAYLNTKRSSLAEKLDFTVDPSEEAKLEASINQTNQQLKNLETARQVAREYYLSLNQAEARRCEITDIIWDDKTTVQLVDTVADIEGTVDTTFFLYAKALADYFERSLLFEWYLGDGRNSNGQNIYFEYPTPGLYEVTLKVSDELTSSQDRLRIRVYETWPDKNLPE